MLLGAESERSTTDPIYRLPGKGLTVRKRRSRRQAVGTHTLILVEAKAMLEGRRISYMTDLPSQRFRVKNIVDDVPPTWLAAISNTSPPSV